MTKDEHPTETDPEMDDWPVGDEPSEETKWIGLYDAPSEGVYTDRGTVDDQANAEEVEETDRLAVLFNSARQSVMQGRIDTEQRRIVPLDETERELNEDETLGDIVRGIGERVGWISLSEFGRNADDSSENTDQYLEQTFQQKNVPASESFQLWFFGSYTLREEGDRKRTVEHEFHVYTDTAHRTEDGKPLAEVTETHLRPANGDGGAEILNEEQTELIVDIGLDLTGRDEENAIETFCKQWHESLPESGTRTH